MANPPYSGFVLIAVEGQDGLELEAWAYDERIALVLSDIPAGSKQQVGMVIPPAPVGLREMLSGSSNPDRYFDRRAANRTTAKTMTSALIDLVFPETAA